MPQPATPSTPTAGAAARGAGGAASRPSTTVDLAPDDAAATTLGRVVYFDYDSYVVRDEFRPMVESTRGR